VCAGTSLSGSSIRTAIRWAATSSVIGHLIGSAACAREHASYADAYAQALANTSTPAGNEYERTKFVPYHEEHDAKSLQACFAHIQKPDTSSFTFVVVLDGEGKAQSFYVDRETTIAECLRTAVLHDTFPPPPFAGFHEAVEMTFTK
jgi:hypothetical protein